MGKVFSTYAEIDILELLNVPKACRLLKDIDLQTILSNFNGHTIFSIYFDNVKVFEAIQTQLEDLDLDDEEDMSGNIVENEKLRRLNKILALPTRDLLPEFEPKEEEINVSLRYC